MVSAVPDNLDRGSPARAMLIFTWVAAVALAAVATGLAAQLYRYGALSGGWVAREAIPRDERAWQWPHRVANAVSVTGGTVIAPLAVLALATWLAVRTRRPRLVFRTGAVVLTAQVCVAAGKWVGGGSAISGPATVDVACWGLAIWLLHRRLSVLARRATHGFVLSAVVAVGVAQLYLGHSLAALGASWLVGTLALAALLAPGRSTATAPPPRDG